VSAQVVDAHVHVFRPAGVRPRTVDELVPAARDAPVEDLLAEMGSAGVDRAVLVALDANDGYLAEVLRAHPGRFAAIAVADAAAQGRCPGADPVSALERRRAALEFGGLRTQWLGDPALPLSESPMLPSLRWLAERGLVLWSYLAPEQLPLLRQLPEALPDLVVVLNHLGFFPHDMRVDVHGRPAFDDPLPLEHVEAVAALARHPSVHLMVSGHYALSQGSPPYPDLDPIVHRLAAAYGAERILWASDYPWIRDVPGYAAMLGLAECALPGASPAELAAIRGGTAMRLLGTLDPSASAS
jgi:L-fuconolactonase